ncbi:hypothetical protein cyc_02337 [Cyclospora cayetanensis]|uniref:MmgE/PrpD family protein n=1 Tax=Cyclospora cayetanensis TaxID=88456 RepID=A0A1D3DAQ0_9EIME|nr:hypothetical protein cyc_02337 [Cyclospora cayetanensis]
MICLDEIRGRLAESFSLKKLKIDHVLHGAIASAAVYGALLGASPEQIESAIGMTVAHYVPYRAIRCGDQLSDSKGASAAFSAEAAVLCMRRDWPHGQHDVGASRFCLEYLSALFVANMQSPEGESPFDLHLTMEGSDFAVMNMHFKLGLYEHQSAGALEGLIQLLSRHPEMYKSPDAISAIEVLAYQPAFGIIGDRAKRNPVTRQSADHSMVYIVATLLRKAIEMKNLPKTSDGIWCTLMLSPHDYSKDAIHNPKTRALMEKVQFVHGGPEFDSKYPEGIPTQVKVTLKDGSKLDSGMVLFPAGHSSNSSANLQQLLNHKFRLLGSLALPEKTVDSMIQKMLHLESASASEVQQLYAIEELSLRAPID